jgi:hypothetical protein
MGFAPKNWNDILAVWVIVLLPVLLVFVYASGIPLPEIVVGALVGGWTLTVQYYWRKAPPEGGVE